jgi:CheY-like chemotaxis protein
MKLKTILLADDNQNDIDLTILALTESKLANNIEVVNDGVEVLEYLRSQGKFKGREPGIPIVILLDLKMPRMDGIEVLKEIKNDPDLKIIPVVMVSSSRQESDLVESYKLGVNAYVVKPVDFNQFVTVIKHLGTFWAVLNELP